VQQCYYTTGGTSFVVILAPDKRAYEALTRSPFSGNECVANFRTLVALDRVKVDTDTVVP